MMDDGGRRRFEDLKLFWCLMIDGRGEEEDMN
jgi:hypothetical protein